MRERLSVMGSGLLGQPAGMQKQYHKASEHKSHHMAAGIEHRLLSAALSIVVSEYCNTCVVCSKRMQSTGHCT